MGLSLGHSLGIPMIALVYAWVIVTRNREAKRSLCGGDGNGDFPPEPKDCVSLNYCVAKAAAIFFNLLCAFDVDVDSDNLDYNSQRIRLAFESSCHK